jgi:hypothetical protein
MESNVTGYYAKVIDNKLIDKYKGATVEVRMVNPKKTGTVFLREYTDLTTGELRDFVDSFGKNRVKKYTKSLTILNLDKVDDLIEYLHIKDHPIYVKSANPIMKVIDITEEAESSIDKRESALDAMLIAKDLRGEKLADFARVLGINTTGVLESVIKSQVYDNAERTPKEFLQSWNDPDRTFKQILFKGKNTKVFTHVNSVWKYRDVTIGIKIEEAISWLKENEDLTPSIRKEINSHKV